MTEPKETWASRKRSIFSVFEPADWIFCAMIACVILGFTGAMFGACQHRAEVRVRNADPTQCRPKVVAINHDYAHSVEDLEVKEHCANVAHKWHVENGVVVCECVR